MQTIFIHRPHDLPERDYFFEKNGHIVRCSSSDFLDDVVEDEVGIARKVQVKILQTVTYTSPDLLQRINFRITANSEVPGYETRVTFDLLQKTEGQFKKIPGNAEIKFVFPK